jgi:hypothetical protein
MSMMGWDKTPRPKRHTLGQKPELAGVLACYLNVEEKQGYLQNSTHAHIPFKR